MSDYLGTEAPRPWEIRASPADGSGGWLRIGHRAYALQDVAGVQASCDVEPNVDGHLLMIAAFMATGVGFVLPVIMNLARTRFVLGGVLFIGIGLMGLTEVLRRRSLRLYKLEIRLRDGTSTEFATADPREALALQAVLQQRLLPRPA